MKRHAKCFWEELFFIGPALFVFIPVVLIPFIYSLIISFTRWDGISSDITFTGLQNYISILGNDADFRTTLIFTARLTAVTSVLANVFGIFFAVQLTKKLRIRAFGRVSLLLPNIMSGVILGYIWQFIFTKAFPEIGSHIGSAFFNLNWLGTPSTAFWGISIVMIWQWTGYTMILYIAGINSIDSEIWEAAELDGVAGFKKFRYITLPLIKPTVTICFFWALTRACTMFDLPYALTGGGPFRSSETITMNIYKEAFTRNHYGAGSAKAMIFFVIVLVIAQLQIFVSNRQEE